MSILVTGGSGQLGSALKEFYPDADCPTLEELDLKSPDLTDKIREINPDMIINCAAIVGNVDKAEVEPEETILVNALAVDKMLKGMRDPTNFIQISSDFVKSDNVYGISKKLSEKFVLLRGGLVIRTSWLFGNGNNWATWTLKNAHKPLTIVDDQIGRPTYAPDLARAIKENENTKGLLSIQNSGREVSWYDYAITVCAIEKIGCSFTPISTADYRTAHPEVAPRPEWSVFQDFAGMPNWEESLKEYLDARR